MISLLGKPIVDHWYWMLDMDPDVSPTNTRVSPLFSTIAAFEVTIWWTKGHLEVKQGDARPFYVSKLLEVTLL